MGILRTDKISGLETPTAVTGSVSFDGVNSALAITENGDHFDFLNSDFTVECWIYPRGGASNNFGTIYSKGYDYQLHWKEDTERLETYLSSNGSSYNISSGTNSGGGSVPANKWSHIAHTREGNTFRLFANGSLLSTITSSLAIGANAVAARLADYGPSQGTYELDGDISNLRVLKGTALYTSDFTPPVHALEVIGDTVLLCCNNPDSVTAASYASIGTSHIITTAGNPTVSTNNPGLTRDFTSGTEFRGVTTFDTQGYFVPPSGTTEQRGRGRVLIAGGNETPPLNVISYVNASTSGNAVDFGDLVTARRRARGLSSSTRGVFTGGFTTTPTATYFDIIDFVTISTTGNAVDFNGNTNGAASFINCASSTRGIMAGGLVPSSPNITDDINYLTIASTGQNVSTFGDLTVARRNAAGFASPTRGIFAAGFTPVPASTMLNTIDFITIASTGNAVDFGDCATTGSGAGSSNSIRGVFQNRTEAGDETIEYVTIASKGNSQDFGNQVTALYMGSEEGGATSTRALWCGGYTNPGSGAGLDNIFYVNIATTGDVQDFGDLTQGTNSNATISDSHGGLS